jgi:ribosomal protein S6E (S10)
MDALLLGATGVLVILLNIFLIPRRQGFQRRYAQRGVWIGAGLVVIAIIRAA